MSRLTASILGVGWATPLGRDLSTVWRAIASGTSPLAQTLENPRSGKTFSVLRVPENSVCDVAAFPRLRRSGLLSHFAVAAALDAITHAELTPDQLARTALVFAASDGGVVYTRRFYADIATRDIGAGSPLLFPETVYNAPASHIAARLGLSGEVLTLVGDAAAGLTALSLAAELLAVGEADHCLVASAQELDWVTCEAYHRWHLIRQNSQPGATLSEGAAALVLSRSGGPQLHFPHRGGFHTTKAEARQLLEHLAQTCPLRLLPNTIISGRSGTHLDPIESEVTNRFFPDARHITPRIVLGESLACAALQQVVTGFLALREQPDVGPLWIPAIGFNGQITALSLTESRPTA
ncbi:MAG: beta-ketoacyl synthase N-terminal-like domain-containing protein [Anaerorhabdus sp.]|uniref:beta-ketoacyl synthase N-terminal-like domain-containing protein n=1 Tax=Anaerorhabdus sp. TaxID=1872524 RepID=UPI003A88B380